MLHQAANCCPRPLPLVTQGGGKPGISGGAVRPLPATTPPHLVDRMQFTLKDKNGDGSLDMKEFGIQAIPPGSCLVGLKEQQEQVKRFERYDANHDGKISQDEYSAGKKLEAFLEKIKTNWDDIRWPGRR